MLSLGNLAPGKEARVTSTWVAPLVFAGEVPTLRIPVTVGEVFGRSPLLPSDDLQEGDVVHEATLKVASDSGLPQILGSGAAEGKVTLDRALGIAVPGWKPRPVEGRSADGRKVTVTVGRDVGGDGALDLAVLFDRSGSTDNVIVGDRNRRKVWAAMRDGLRDGMDGALRPRDRIHLAEFDNSIRVVGEATGPGALALIDSLRKPAGGTEIGVALAATMSRKTGDVLLITDGKSHALDVQKLASMGSRVSVVLVGDDALDAGVGHLAAMTGGQTFVAVGADVEGAVRAALASFRVAASLAVGGEGAGLPAEASLRRGGALVGIEWGEKASKEAPDAIGRYAAAAVLPLLKEDVATEVAVAHGLCTHLTSLVVVDEAGESVQGIPATRKVPMMRPSGVMRSASSSLRYGSAAPVRSMLAAPAPAPAGSWSSGEPATMSFAASDATRSRGGRSRSLIGRPSRGAGMSFGRNDPFHDLGGDDGAEDLAAFAVVGRAAPLDLRAVASTLDWDSLAPALESGSLDPLPASARLVAMKVAEIEEVVALAKSLGKDAVTVAIALLARSASGNRTAERLARRLLKGADEALVDAARIRLAA